MNPSMAAPAAADIGCTDQWRRAEIPAANGHATARGLATMYSALANGGEHAGVRLLSAEAVGRAREGQGATVDVVLGIGTGGLATEWALGFLLSGEHGLLGPNPRAFGHGGYGGSFGLADPDAGASLGYVMNHMGNNLILDPRQVALFTALYECL
jgi:CubicO group peptidase (beta-lactamase class C family)